MPRHPRVHFSGALFHAMARGNGGQKIYFDDADHNAFLNVLSDIKTRKPFRLYAYCLMSNHFHLLIEVDRFSISLIMQRLMTRYAKHFNIRRRRFGHVFQGRFKAILCQKDSYLILELLRYIHLNPVRANMVPDPSAWPWSGHHEYLGKSGRALVDSAFPLSMFHLEPARARALYSRFLQDGIGQGHDDDFSPAAAIPCLGDPNFQSDFLELARKRGRKEPEAEIKPKSLDAWAEEALATLGLPKEALRGGSRSRSLCESKRSFILQALHHGFKPSLVAAFLRCSPSAVSHTVARFQK